MESAQPYGCLMKQDIESQAETLIAVYESFSSQVNSFTQLQKEAWAREGWIFTGCGTTYALALTSASLFQKLGMTAAALPASEVAFYPECLPQGGSMLLAFSRSGETSETLWAVDAFRKQRAKGKIFTVTASPESALAQKADFVLNAAPARDRSTVETKSFSGMLYLLQVFSAWVSGNGERLDRLKNIPPKMKRLLSETRPAAEHVGKNPEISRFFFLGSAENYGLACQAAFTMKECSAEWSEAFHPLEFRHGPRTAATGKAFVGLFLTDDRRAIEQELRVIREMKDQGAQTLVLGDRLEGSDFPSLEGVNYLDLGSGLALADRLTLYLPFVQWLAYARALSAGKDPDHPANLRAVTRL